jgi:hypothetical protein
VPPRRGQRLQVLEREVGAGHDRLRRTSPPHRDDRRPPAALAEHTGEVARDRRLARPLAGADHGEHSAVEVEPVIARRLE